MTPAAIYLAFELSSTGLRYEEQGIEGLKENSRRPQHSPGKTEAAEQQVVKLRKQWPEWGARKISKVLGEAGTTLPSSTVHRIFERHGVIREQDRQPAALKRFEREAPNQLWQMDFNGPKGRDKPVEPLSMLDDHLRYVTLLQRTSSTQAAGVQEALEKAFCECGVTEAMLMDHGTPWCNARGSALASTCDPQTNRCFPSYQAVCCAMSMRLTAVFLPGSPYLQWCEPRTVLHRWLET